jgi:hypothetical protein
LLLKNKNGYIKISENIAKDCLKKLIMNLCLFKIDNLKITVTTGYIKTRDSKEAYFTVSATLVLHQR